MIVVFVAIICIKRSYEARYIKQGHNKCTADLAYLMKSRDTPPPKKIYNNTEEDEDTYDGDETSNSKDPSLHEEDSCSDNGQDEPDSYHTDEDSEEEEDEDPNFTPI